MLRDVPLEDRVANIYTKRGFSKKLAMLFDPMQMLAPFTIKARMALQKTLE